MFVSEAYAQAAGGGAGGAFGGGMSGIFMLVLIFVVFWFLLIRPQQKRMKEHKLMIAALKRGDEVVTGGGIIGKVSKVISDGEIQVEIAKDVKVKVSRASIQAVLNKPAPASSTPSGGDKKPGGLGGLLGKR